MNWFTDPWNALNSKSFTEQNKNVLDFYNLADKTLVKESFEEKQNINWKQASRKLFGECSEEYSVYTYYVEYNEDQKVLVYVATKFGEAPDKISTNGHKGKLHFGNIFFSGNSKSAVFFVLHSNEWGPFQHRFQTNLAIGFFMKTSADLVQTVLPSFDVAAYLGQYLRYIG